LTTAKLSNSSAWRVLCHSESIFNTILSPGHSRGLRKENEKGKEGKERKRKNKKGTEGKCK